MEYTIEPWELQGMHSMDVPNPLRQLPRVGSPRSWGDLSWHPQPLERWQHLSCFRCLFKRLLELNFSDSSRSLPSHGDSKICEHASEDSVTFMDESLGTPGRISHYFQNTALIWCTSTSALTFSVLAARDSSLISWSHRPAFAQKLSVACWFQADPVSMLQIPRPPLIASRRSWVLSTTIGSFTWSF
jgi:hypothetical protein